MFENLTERLMEQGQVLLAYALIGLEFFVIYILPIIVFVALFGYSFRNSSKLSKKQKRICKIMAEAGLFCLVIGWITPLNGVLFTLLAIVTELAGAAFVWKSTEKYSAGMR